MTAKIGARHRMSLQSSLFAPNALQLRPTSAEKGQLMYTNHRLAVMLLLGGCAVAEDAGERRVRAPDAGVATDGGQLVVPGPVDVSFGQRGLVTFPVPGVEPRDMVIDAEGRIVVAGWIFIDATSSFEGYVFRFLPDGSLDRGFDGDGVHRIAGKNPFAATIALAPDGKIVVGGSCDCDAPARIWRLRADGSPDPSFASGG